MTDCKQDSMVRLPASQHRGMLQKIERLGKQVNESVEVNRILQSQLDAARALERCPCTCGLCDDELDAILKGDT